MAFVKCLHTAESNAAVFDAACPPELHLEHHFRPDLLAEAERAGEMPESLALRTAELLQDLARDGAPVLLTCSTLGPAATRAAFRGEPILRADAALALAARQRIGRILALYAAPTSREPACSLFNDGSGRIEARLVPDAWPHFQAGDLAGYHRIVAQAADVAFASGMQTVALAQASMAPALRLCRAGVPLTAPEEGLRAAMRRASR